MSIKLNTILADIPLFGERLPPVGFANEIIRNVGWGKDSSGDKHHIYY